VIIIRVDQFVPLKKIGTSITPKVAGDALDETIIGSTTPAAGNFTTLGASTDPVGADGVGDRGFNDARYLLESNNLSDVDTAATAFTNIKQDATESAAGVLEKATTDEVVTGTDTDRAVTPAGVTARMGAPGNIGGTTPGAGEFTSVGINTTTPSGQFHTVLSAGKPALFGGDTLATVTGVSGTDADPTVLTVATTNGVAIGDAVIINSGTNATVGTYFCTAVVVDTSVTLNKNASSGGAISAASVTYVNDALVIENGTNGGPRIILPLKNDAVTPTVAFGDGDSGFYESSDDNLKISIAGSNSFFINSTTFGGINAAGGSLLNEGATSTNPTLISDRSDDDTGIGHAAADALSLIAGGVEGIRITEDTSIEVMIAKNDSWLSELNFAGTDAVNMFKVNVDDEIEVGGTLVLGASLEAAEDSGVVTAFDMPVSADPDVGTEESFTHKIDGNNVLTVGAFADSAGGVTGEFVKNHGAVVAHKTDMGANPYNPSALTSDYIITVDTTAAARAVTISTEDRDTGSSDNPRIFVIKDIAGNAGANNITVSLETAGNIDGAGTAVINGNYNSITLAIDGTNGYII